MTSTALTISKSKPRQRLIWLMLAFGLLLAAERMVSFASEGGAPVRAPRPAADAAVAPAASAAAEGSDVAGGLRWQRLAERERATQNATLSDPFAAAPPARAPVAAPTPVPVVEAKPPLPPFSYRYFGSLLDDGVRTAFFTRNERVLRVRAGDTVDGQFRVDTLDEAQLALTHLASGERLVVSLGSAP